MSKNVIEIKDLVKLFGKSKALDGLNLSVSEGQIHGFLGPNGAGKSTTIRILLGILKKTSGEARLFGEDPWDNSTTLHSKLAYVPGDVELWPNLTGGEIIDYLSSLRGQMDKERRNEMIKLFKLDPSKKFRTYSKGNRQKVALISALASDVPLYILDEPTSGFDPLMESVFQDCVRNLKKEGKTVLLSSHILEEVENVCDSVTIIRDGKTVSSGKLSDIQKMHSTRFKVITKTGSSNEMAKIKGLINLESNGNEHRFSVEGSNLDVVLKSLSNIKIDSISSHPPTLEELFMGYYSDKKDAKE